MLRSAEYSRRRRALYKSLKSGMITWDDYHRLRAKLDREFADVVHDAGAEAP